MKTTDMEQIMKIIKSRRECLGYSYQDLSNLTGISKSTLQRYETGNIHNIPLSKVRILAEALKTTPEYLMGWEDEKTASAVIETEEALKQYFIGKIGRLPTDEELKRLDDFADVFIKGMDK